MPVAKTIRGLAASVILAASLNLVMLAAPGLARAYEPPPVPPGASLDQAETDHFRLIYDKNLKDTAPEVLRHLEEAYGVLTRVFDWKPALPVDVLYVDGFDTHNGWATAIPENTIAIYAAGPEPGSFIYQPGDYLRSTAFHELAHALTMDMRYGPRRALSAVFGKSLPLAGDPVSALLALFTNSPLAFAPRWYQEGTSQWAETLFSRMGRGRASMVEMYFRAAVEGDALLDFEQWYPDHPAWPMGNAPYLYGLRLLEYVYRHGPEPNPVGELTGRLARQWWFDVNDPARETMGLDFQALATRMLKEVSRVQSANLARLGTVPTTDHPRLTPERLGVRRAVFAGSDIIMAASQASDSDTLYRYTPATRNLEKLPVPVTAAFCSLAALDRRTVFYTRINVQDNAEFYYEVHELDPVSGQDRVIDDENRYREVDPSPDGLSLIATSMRRARSYLIEVRLGPGGLPASERLLLESSPQTVYSQPRVSPDNRFIAFAEADQTGSRLRLYSRKTGTVRTLVDSDSIISSPAWHPDSRTLAYSHDANGVFNIYRIVVGQTPDPPRGAGDQPREISGTGEAFPQVLEGPTPLSHVTGGAFSPSFSPDGEILAVTGYDARGFHLATLEHDPGALAHVELPVVDHGWPETPAGLAGLARAGLADAHSLDTTPAEALGRGSSYWGLANMDFDYWAPWATASAWEAQAGAGAAFSDPTGYHAFTALGGVETEYETPLWSALYTWKGMTPALRLYTRGLQEVYPNLLYEPATGAYHDHAEEVRASGAVLEIPLYTMEVRVSLEAGYEYRTREFIDDVREDWAGRSLTILPVEQDKGLAWSRLTWSDVDIHADSFSVEDGRVVSAATEYSHPDIGGRVNQDRHYFDWQEYVSLPFTDNHVIKLSGAYGLGDGQDTATGLFGIGGTAGPLSGASPGIPDSLGLRGYPPNFQTGETAMKLSAAYRFPLVSIYRGWEFGLPLYIGDIWAEAFYDGGRVRRGDDELGWLSSGGLELSVAMRLFRHLRFSPGVGAALAPRADERDPDASRLQIYASINSWAAF